MSNNKIMPGAVKQGAQNEGEFWKMFAKNIIKRRMQLNLTQSWVSRRAGMGRTAYVKVERGRRRVSVWELQQIAKALCVPAIDILPKIPLAD